MKKSYKFSIFALLGFLGISLMAFPIASKSISEVNAVEPASSTLTLGATELKKLYNTIGQLELETSEKQKASITNVNHPSLTGFDETNNALILRGSTDTNERAEITVDDLPGYVVSGLYIDFIVEGIPRQICLFGYQNIDNKYYHDAVGGIESHYDGEGYLDYKFDESGKIDGYYNFGFSAEDSDMHITKIVFTFKKVNNFFLDNKPRTERYYHAYTKYSLDFRYFGITPDMEINAHSKKGFASFDINEIHVNKVNFFLTVNIDTHYAEGDAVLVVNVGEHQMEFAFNVKKASLTIKSNNSFPTYDPEIKYTFTSTITGIALVGTYDWVITPRMALPNNGQENIQIKFPKEGSYTIQLIIKGASYNMESNILTCEVKKNNVPEYDHWLTITEVDNGSPINTQTVIKGIIMEYMSLKDSLDVDTARMLIVDPTNGKGMILIGGVDKQSSDIQKLMNGASVVIKNCIILNDEEYGFHLYSSLITIFSATPYDKHNVKYSNFNDLVKSSTLNKDYDLVSIDGATVTSSGGGSGGLSHMAGGYDFKLTQKHSTNVFRFKGYGALPNNATLLDFGRFSQAAKLFDLIDKILLNNKYYCNNMFTLYFPYKEDGVLDISLMSSTIDSTKITFMRFIEYMDPNVEPEANTCYGKYPIAKKILSNYDKTDFKMIIEVDPSGSKGQYPNQDAALRRYVAWANANNDATPFGDYHSDVYQVASNLYRENENFNEIITIVSLLGLYIIGITSLVLVKHKRKHI